MSTRLTIQPDLGASVPLASNALAKPHIEALDGLRFLAAFFVAAAHYSAFLLTDPKQPNLFAEIILSMAGLGMTLFFVLSGFVIHYNYREIIAQPGGFKTFAIARFSRLYPLYIVLFVGQKPFGAQMIIPPIQDRTAGGRNRKASPAGRRPARGGNGLLPA